MQKIIYYCDRCGKEIIDEHNVIKNAKWGYHYELCKTCDSELLDLIVNFMNGEKTDPEQEPEVKTEQEKPKKKKRGGPHNSKNKLPLDLAKIGALYVAGWKPKDIAPEVGCCESTVRNRLNEALEVYKESLK